MFGHGFNTKLSSAGLVYKHYGREVVASLLGLDASNPDVEVVYLQVRGAATVSSKGMKSGRKSKRNGGLTGVR